MKDQQRDGVAEPEVRAELRKCEGKLAAVLDALGEHAVVSLDRDGVVVEWNGGAAKLLGRGGDVIGRPFASLFGDAGATLAARALASAAACGRVELDAWPARGDGTRFPARIVVSCADGSGTPSGFVVVVHDRTARHRADEALRFFAESTALHRAEEDVDPIRGVASMLVPRFADVAIVVAIGDDGAPELRDALATDGRRCALLHAVARHGLASDAMRQAAIRATAGKVLVDALPDGIAASIGVDPAVLDGLGLRSIMCVPLVARGRTHGALVLATTTESGRTFHPDDLDLADRLGVHVALAMHNARLYRELQDAARARDEFLATLSHELRTPLNAVLGWTHLLRTGALGKSEAARALDVIERNARAQASLVEDILDTSRIVTGKMHLRVVATEPRGAVQAAIDAVASGAIAKRITIDASLDDVGVITADEARLQQIAWNLLANAIKFTRPGGRVEVRLARTPPDVVLVVRDDGEGIAPSFLPHVFERFRQADGSPSREKGGLGLGLAIVRHLVELHGGRVDVASAGVGKGATFTVRLPIPAVQPPMPRESLREPGRLTGVRVLVIDDDADALALVEHVLRRSGADVITACGADEAIELLRDGAADAVVSDIAMPGEDGFRLLARLRDAMPHVPALALTGYARREDRERALAAGFQEYVRKPVDPRELVEAVVRIVAPSPTPRSSRAA